MSTNGEPLAQPHYDEQHDQQAAQRALRLSYFLRIPNVGDLANAPLVARIGNRPTTHANANDQPHLLAIGSILAAANPFSRVWGSGVMDPRRGIGNATGSRIHAVRGRLTAECLTAAGVALGDVPHGDPGFLAPALLGIAAATQPKFRLGLVAHYVDRERPFVKRILKEDGVLDLDVRTDPLDFLSAMSQCEVIASSSLHGLIFAEALGLPNLWLELGNEVVGDGFKFRDWYSTTSRPQAVPLLPAATDCASDIVNRCELRGSKIDTNALLASFPTAHIEEMSAPISTSFAAARSCRQRPTPVFLISYNRGEQLHQTIQAIRALDRAVDIIVHDNGSSDAATIAKLKTLESDGVTIVHNKPITHPDELNLVNITVENYFREWGEPCRYVVSDCDIDMSICDRNVLDVYDEILNTIRQASCVGPMLRISDIPRNYPLFNRVMNRHIEQFWKNRPELIYLHGREIAYQEAMIDTTFALHRAGEAFSRMKSGVRCYAPYEARHLDWYPENRVSDVYATSSSPQISHWNNASEQLLHEDAVLEHRKYFCVRTDQRRISIHEQILTD